MTLLPDHKISREIGYGELVVEPVDLEKQLQPASLDIRLGSKVKKFLTEPRHSNQVIRPDMDISSEMLEREIDDSLVIRPGEFYLVNTVERFEIPDNILVRLTGRSSVARMALSVHQTAGLFDPGFKGEGVLEIKNVGPRSVELKPGMRVAQMTFEKLDGSANTSYNSEDNKYQNQEGAVESKIQEDDF